MHDLVTLNYHLLPKLLMNLHVVKLCQSVNVDRTLWSAVLTVTALAHCCTAGAVLTSDLFLESGGRTEVPESGGHALQ